MGEAGISLVLNSLLKTGVLDDDFEDEKDDAYNEAIKEMLKEL
ncbi:hypothetical protein Tco_1033549, partial [Tanacetum coccineum]